MNQTQLPSIDCFYSFKELKNKQIETYGIFIGKIEVARYMYDIMSPKEDNNKYKVVSLIPTIRVKDKRYKTHVDCRNVCVEIAKTYLNQLSYKEE
jgi:hypothetical protein